MSVLCKSDFVYNRYICACFQYSIMKQCLLCFFSVIFFFSTGFLCVACKEKKNKEDKTISVTGVRIDRNELKMNTGDMEQLFSAVLPENASRQTVRWSSDNEDVATVDESGRVSARRSGQAVITVTTDDGSHTANCRVTVIDPEPEPEPKPILPFIKTQGAGFIDGNGQEIVFRGMGFYHGNVTTAPETFNEKDFANMADIGCNSIRFYLSAGFFENTSTHPVSYQPATWSWLDQRIAWAKKYKMTLILCMVHTPGATGISDRTLFTDQDRQNRLVALWKTIAQRYKDEPAIAAYELMNEPTAGQVDGEATPYPKTFELYRKIVQRIVDAIREVDFHHVIIIERLWIAGVTDPNDHQDNWQNINGTYNFPPINDPANNYALTYHCYEPVTYTHQTNITDVSANNTDRVYPNPTEVAKWGTVDQNGMQISQQETLPANETEMVTITKTYQRPLTENPERNIARIDLQIKNLPADGKVYFHKAVVREYDENHEYIRDVACHDFSLLYHGKAYNNSAGIVYDATGRCFVASGPISDGLIRSNGKQFLMVKGHYYEVEAGIKGENIGEAVVYPTFFINSRPQAWGYTKEFLAYIYTLPLNYIINISGVPAYIGELGISTQNFTNNHYGENRGGARWIEDVFDILLNQYKVSCNFHPYYVSEISPVVDASLSNALKKAFGK